MTNAIVSDAFNDSELKFILEKFERIHISIYGLDSEEYQTMTRRSYYPRMLNSVKRIIKLSEGKQNIFIGFRFLKNHTIEDIKIWIQQNFESEIPFNFTNSYSNWGNAIETSKKLPFDGLWLPTPENKEQCLIPLFAFQIFSNGDISFCPCPDYNGVVDLKLGNIAKNNLCDIYNSRKCQELWNFNTHIPDFCKKCSFFKPLSELPHYENAINNPLELIGG
jgi:radical SAM protein with 4Fe4S-binding SPASM domain